ncbi:betaine-aldehyde dehydrogenase [Marinobacterium rhizophilum]|uniref:Betaine aldehyde dehydrogenase n=1 Tax=Marinobacterium rhizophilum TaxID=420402 RepID=A0ABY5HNQ8_9GAMM|nr:betaine-aldehyde dehydrogenase [Marinobacterium rhizophilum]UTW12889.1 betaine-aldehyde dehydrogenase [Marinobacterium rhizophilum]
MPTLTEQKSYIDGRYIDDADAERFETRNPATGDVICTVQQASENTLELAVESARQGQADWAALGGSERGRILKRAADILRSRNDALARLEVLDTGKPIQEALAVDIHSGADAIEYYAGVAPTLHGDHYDLGGSFAFTRREPLGLCAGIGAWNYPIQIASWKSAPALACGNAMIYKPSEMTPLTALKLAEIYTEAGVPPGVFNVVQGDARVGQWFTAHRDISKVSLTGDVATGRKVMAAAAASLKHVTLELGGKSPLIIFADSDLDDAVSAALMANFYTQGEICSNGTRVFVERSIEQAFLQRLVARTRKMVIGDPMNPNTHVGALISEAHMHKVLGHIENGKSAGAELLHGGRRHMANGCDRGYFVEPTIFAQCRDDMSIVQQEIFGPVMSVLSFDDEQEVIARANNTEYGLAAGVFTRDLQRAHRVVARLKAGTCWINNYNITPIEMPFGGYKQSGLGRENSLAAIEHYTQLKSVYVEMGKVEAPY